jgi:hypothetical protein
MRREKREIEREVYRVTETEKKRETRDTEEV